LPKNDEKLPGGFLREVSRNKAYKPNKKIPLYVNSFMISHIMESDSLAGKSFQTWL